jgi:hypothetical protein
MRKTKLPNSRPWIAAAVSGLALAGFSGCVDYTKRRDTLTLSAGEAQAWNRAVHVTDPWPPSSGNTHIDGDGQRVSRVIEAYRKGTGSAPPAPRAEISSENAAEKEDPQARAAE